jgi:hypothetical protein
MAESITGSVVGKVKFQIDSQSWKNLEKFQAKMASVKRQMSSMHKTIKVQAVVKQMTDVTKRVTNNSISEKKREMNAHVAAKQKHDAYVSKLHDQALAEDRRRDIQRVKQAERTNAQMLRSDLRLDAQRRAAQMRADRLSQRNAGNSSRFTSRANMYERIKVQQASHAGVDAAGLKRIKGLAQQARGNSGGDIAVFRFQLQQLTKDLIKNTREINNNRVTLRSLRTDLVQMTAAYTAFSGVVNVAQTGMEINF